MSKKWLVLLALAGLLIGWNLPIYGQAPRCKWQMQIHKFGHYEEIELLLNSLSEKQARDVKVVSFHSYGSEGTPATDLAVWVCVP